MAQQFSGFNANQVQGIAKKMGYEGPMNGFPVLLLLPEAVLSPLSALTLTGAQNGWSKSLRIKIRRVQGALNSFRPGGNFILMTEECGQLMLR